MLRRTRSQKKLAKRIEMDYFARPHPLRRWRRILSIAIPVVALGWLVTTRARGSEKVYSSGPLSASHAVFGQQCSACHVTRAGKFREHVTDDACLNCHDAPAHNLRQTSAPACSSCHVEHTGKLQLARTSDQACTQCHADLAKHTKDMRPHFENAVLHFSGAHPEFAVLREKKGDPGTVRLNHYVHLQPTLKGPDGKPVQLECGDCHRPVSSQGQWTYGNPALKSAPPKTDQGTVIEKPFSDKGMAYMAAIKYEKQCMGCHLLQFDKRFTDQVPHDKPDVIHPFLVKKFTEYIASHPAEIRQVTAPEQLLPGPTRPIPVVAHNASEWVSMRVEESERLLWGKTCKECHTLDSTPGQLPKVPKADIPSRWMPHSVFDHQAHAMVRCASCHTKSVTSRETADVLIPGVETCRQCHVTATSAQTEYVAEGSCFECHEYHQWEKRHSIKPRFSISELLGKNAPAPPHP
jgi:hypothetical protein